MAGKKKRLLLIDANSLIHRAFHALPPLSAPTGEMVNAVYGFCLAFFKAQKEFRPDYIAAAFDVAGPTFRDKKFKAYKAKREKAPDELYHQMPLVKKVLAAFHVPVYEKEGFEADDIIGTISLQAPRKQVKPPLETIILSGDADVFQLVDKHTKAYALRKGIQDSVLYDEKAIEKRFGGLRPEQLVDYKALRGDPSDNIPGVTGIGEKTAIALLLQFGSLENIYQELQENTEAAQAARPRLRDMLLQYKDQASISRELAQIERHAPIEFKLSGLAWKDFDEKEVEQLFQSFGFRSLTLRLPELHGDAKSASSADAPTRRKEQREDQSIVIEQLERDGVLSKKIAEVERKLTPVLRAMEKTGITIDKEYFAALEKDMRKELTKAESKIFELAENVFNVSSPRQLSQVLFGKLMLSPKGMHKTPGGLVSTASPELEKIKSLHPIIQEVLNFRELSKLLNTYVMPLPLLADKEGRIHTHFEQFGAETGRLSSVSPNLQNIPLQGGWGKKVRGGFVAAPGYQLASFDYSQVELRVAAHIAKEEKMLQIFKANEDIHRMTASVIFGIPANQVSDEMRYRAKALNFGVLYGMGARGFAESAKIPTEEAQQFIDDYFMRFPRIALYIEQTKEFVKEKGYAETILGRRRYLPDINSFTPQIRAGAERAAVNFPVQGTAADIMKMAMVRVFKECESEGCRMLLQIHDELLFEVADDIVEESARNIKKIMEEVVLLSIPLPVQVKTGLTWGDMKRVEA
jgi:DNA polymerase I-like protein with 3'-5' exonuclease and polymerase domains/5'-3' exonuclease